MTQQQILMILAPVALFSLTVHEYSHGRVAYMLGDDTAARMGRLTFNPLKHLDVLGTLCILIFHFGWAKPVPVDPRNLRDPRRDMLLVALAGPASNLILALICGFFARVLFLHVHDYRMLFSVLCVGVYINVILALFNLLPVFPLDGASILKGLVPEKFAQTLTGLDKYMMVLLMGIVLMDAFAKTGILGRILFMPVMIVVQFLTQEAFPGLVELLFTRP